MGSGDFDYIIVGAGAAGCVLANRLSENPDNRVLLIESGGRDLNPMHYVPKGFYFTLASGRYTYHYATRPFTSDGHGEVWTRGKVIGGSTTVNGMMYTRGFPADYDGLVKRGNPGWGWDEILPIFKMIEDHQLGGTDLRGRGGPYGVSVPEGDEVSNAILDAGENSGLKFVRDTNAEESERIGFTPSSIKNGKRVSASSAFLHPILRRRNLTVATRTQAGYLLFDGRRVVGVRTQHRGSARDYLAVRDVIVSAGTIESTLLLERSGIGNPEILRRVGVRVVAESPNVGEHVIEQRGLAMQVKFKDPLGATQKLNSLPKQGWEGFKYLLTRRGPIADTGYNVLCAFRSSSKVERPDIQGLFVPLALDATQFDSVKLAGHSGTMFLGYQISPTTESSVHLSSAQPGHAPVIDAHYLESDIDRKVTSTILDRARRVFATNPLVDLIAEEEYPGPAVSTPDEVLRYAIDSGATIYHAVGANAMGPDDDHVTDAHLRVRGVTGLRVIDASVFPTQVAGNTAAPTMALAWRAADLILNEE